MSGHQVLCFSQEGQIPCSWSLQMSRSLRTFLFKNRIKPPCLSSEVLRTYITQMAIKQDKYCFIANHSQGRGFFEIMIIALMRSRYRGRKAGNGGCSIMCLHSSLHRFCETMQRCISLLGGVPALTLGLLSCLGPWWLQLWASWGCHLEPGERKKWVSSPSTMCISCPDVRCSPLRSKTVISPRPMGHCPSVSHFRRFTLDKTCTGGLALWRETWSYFGML